MKYFALLLCCAMQGCIYAEYPTPSGRPVRYMNLARTEKADGIRLKAPDGTEVEFNGVGGDVSQAAIEALAKLAAGVAPRP